jgi:hypothetical protein
MSAILATLPRPTTGKRRPIRVDFQANPWDKQLKAMQRAGFTIETAAKHTGLSKGQATYRWGETGFSYMKFRRGETPEAQQLMHRIERALGIVKEMRRDVRRFSSRPRGKPDRASGRSKGRAPA